jgi:hypothetical protein
VKHDAIQPPPALVPAILIELGPDGRWHATAVIANDGEPIGLDGPSTTPGASPSAALDRMLGRHFGRAIGRDLPATAVAIDREAIIPDHERKA